MPVLHGSGSGQPETCKYADHRTLIYPHSSGFGQLLIGPDGEITEYTSVANLTPSNQNRGFMFLFYGVL